MAPRHMLPRETPETTSTTVPCVTIFALDTTPWILASIPDVGFRCGRIWLSSCLT